MRKNAPFVPGVPGLCRALCRAFHSCAGCAGSPIGGRAREVAAQTPMHKKTLLRIYTPGTPGTPGTPHINQPLTQKQSGTTSGTPGTNNLIRFKNERLKMEKSQITTRRISVTQDNAADARAMVRRWPALDSLVQSLQAQGMFPGLRAMQITLTGHDEWVGKGLGAVMSQNAPTAVSGDSSTAGRTQ